MISGHTPALEMESGDECELRRMRLGIWATMLRLIKGNVELDWILVNLGSEYVQRVWDVTDAFQLWAIYERWLAFQEYTFRERECVWLDTCCESRKNNVRLSRRCLKDDSLDGKYVCHDLTHTLMCGLNKKFTRLPLCVYVSENITRKSCLKLFDTEVRVFEFSFFFFSERYKSVSYYIEAKMIQWSFAWFSRFAKLGEGGKKSWKGRLKTIFAPVTESVCNQSVPCSYFSISCRIATHYRKLIIGRLDFPK